MLTIFENNFRIQATNWLCEVIFFALSNTRASSMHFIRNPNTKQWIASRTNKINWTALSILSVFRFKLLLSLIMVNLRCNCTHLCHCWIPRIEYQVEKFKERKRQFQQTFFRYLVILTWFFFSLFCAKLQNLKTTFHYSEHAKLGNI